MTEDQAPLVVECGRHGKDTRVLLNGVDISRHLTGVRVTCGVDEVSRAELSYTGAVLVTGELGEIELTQDVHYVECTCGKPLKGEKHEPTLAIVDSTRFQQQSRSYVAVTR